MVCSTCGAQSSDDSDACVHCGSPLALDMRILKRRVRETPGLLPELVRIFFEQGGTEMQELHEAVMRFDCNEVERLAHNIKNTVSNFAAQPASQAALSLETMARDGHAGKLKEAYTVLAKEVVRLQSALKALTEDAIR